MAKAKHDCDILGYCPFNAVSGWDCYNLCGLGADNGEDGKDDDYDEVNYYPDESMQDYPN